MKRLAPLIAILAAFGFGLPAAAVAQEKKEPAKAEVKDQKKKRPQAKRPLTAKKKAQKKGELKKKAE
jgi:hypothetical protein